MCLVSSFLCFLIRHTKHARMLITATAPWPHVFYLQTQETHLNVYLRPIRMTSLRRPLTTPCLILTKHVWHKPLLLALDCSHETILTNHYEHDQSNASTDSSILPQSFF